MSPAERARLRMWRSMEGARKRLVAAIPAPDQPGDFAPLVIDALRGMGWAAWVELDERSGYRDWGAWFSLVRQVRNSPTHGTRLLRAVNAASNRLTLGYVREELAQVGVTIRRTGCGDEVCVRLRGAPAGHGVFVHDLADALGTGLAMARERDAGGRAA
jgi:hypothetical protein